MKVHDEIESLTDVYLAGGLEAGERSQVEEHAATCDACAGILRDAKAFHGWARGSSAPGAPPTGLEDRIIANLRASTHRRAPKLIRFLAGVAAVFALIVVGGMFSHSDQLMEVRNKLVAQSGALVYDENTGHEVKFIRHKPGIDGYAGDSTAEGEVVGGWGSEGQTRGRTADKSTMGVGGGAGGGGRYGGRTGGKKAEMKELADARPAPATAAPGEPMMDGESADHNEAGEELRAERKSLEKESPNKPGEPKTPVVDDRKIIRNADLHLEVEVYEAAYTKIGEITRAKKGFVAGASTTKLANGKIRATVTLRIPPEKFEETLAELAKLGNVRHQAISTSDVTKQYTDLESRLKSKETLVERLKKVLLEGKGTVKELMEVEVQMGATIEQIESIKGELKYYDNLVGLSTITMQVFEKDMGLPFEYVQTMQATISVTAAEADARYAQAQKEILDAGGQVVESRMTRANDDSASGFVRGKVDAEKFPAVREKLKALGHVDQDTVNQQQTGRGGQGDARPGAPVRKEQAVIDFTVNTPPVMVTRQAAIAIEASPAETAYQEARKEVEAAGGKILGGSLTDRTGGATAFVKAQVDDDKFAGLVEKLKGLGKLKNATVKQDEPGSDTGKAPLIRKKGEIVFEIATPAPLIPEESGLGRVLRDTFSRSVAGVLWSIEKLFVGIALAGPWIVLAILVLLIWKKVRRPKAA